MPACLHLFSTDLAQARIADLSRLLSPTEQERAGRFQFEADRARSVASRGTLRLILSRYLDRPAESIPFVHGIHGKPSIRPAERGGVQFSLSRSRDLCIVAVTDDVRIGVDLEQVRRLDEALTIAKSRFSPAEASAIDSPEAFFALWTRKEAVSKCLGWGLNLPFDVFEVPVPLQPRPARVVVAFQGERTEQWVQHVPLEHPGFVAAIANEGEEPAGLHRDLGLPPL